MKTPDEIKKGLECCSLSEDYCGFDCPYAHTPVHCGRKQMQKDALTYIQQLESSYSQVSKALCGKENATLDEVLQAASQVKTDASRKDDTIRNLTELLNAANDEAAKYKRERDAAVLDLKRQVLNPRKVCLLCKNRNKPICNMCEGCDVFEWRGICP